MRKEDSIFDNSSNFVLDYFAENQTEWEVYAESKALGFIKEYNKNFNFMLKKLKDINSSKGASTGEIIQGRVISDIVVLRRMIEINQEKRSVNIDFSGIEKTFVKVTDKEKIDQLNNAIDDIERFESEEKRKNSLSDGAKTLPSFKKLCAYYSDLVSFVKEKEVRKDFYVNYLKHKEIYPTIIYPTIIYPTADASLPFDSLL